MNFKGAHHLYLGWLLAIAGISAMGLGFGLQSWALTFSGIGGGLFGLLVALDDAIGDRFGIATPVKRADRWLKRNVALYYEICLKLDKLLGKEN